MSVLLPNGTIQGEACDRLEGVADRLEAWAEAENNLVRFATITEGAAEAAGNRRDNYTALVATIREAVEAINARPIPEHPDPSGIEAYRKLSSEINSTNKSEWMEEFLDEFAIDHPTLQASLYRELNSVMRERHTFRYEDIGGGVTKMVCTDGRIAGDLPEFIKNGHIPLI